MGFVWLFQHETDNEGTKVLLRRLEEGVWDNRRIYLENKLIVRETVKDIRKNSKEREV